MTLQFYVMDVQFSGTDRILNKQISYTFDTDIKSANAAFQGINFSYDNGPHYVEVARLDISDVQVVGPTIDCSVEVEFHSNKNHPIEKSSAKVLFIADCE